MPFAIMLYLMMTLAQLHGTQMFRRGMDSAPSVSSFALATDLNNFRREVGWTAKANGHVYLPGDPTQYMLGDFVPP